MHSIMILEADPKVADILQTQLRKRRFEVTLCSTIQKAQQQLKVALPDAFLIDLNTADTHFASFYAWLRETPQLSNIPRLFLASSSRIELADQIRAASQDVLLQKPLRISSLIDGINTQLGHVPNGVAHSTASNPAQAQIRSSLPQEPDPHEHTDRQLDQFIGKQIGNVTLERELGRGGMGAVYLGRQTTLERQVAVKVMLPDLVGDSSALVRFRREALAIARLKSPHIVQVFDAGTTDQQVFYIVMEYLEGGTIDDYLQTHSRLNSQHAIDVLCQVAEGLHTAHNAGLIHRDLKPSNLMINPSSHVTITDFGLVREHGVDEEHKLTKQGSLLGTPYYLSPEQAAGATLDPRTDLYSLGIIGYELVVGEVPFNSNNLLDILVMHHNLPLPDPRQKVRDVPEELVAILQRLAAKKPSERYPSAEALLTDLEPFRTQTRMRSSSVQMLSAAHIRPSMNTPSKAFQLTTGAGERLSAYSSQSESSLSREQARGKAILGPSGELNERQGQFSDVWIRALSICVGVVQQLQTLPNMGSWNFAQIEGMEDLLHIHPHSNQYEAILLKPSLHQHSMQLGQSVNNSPLPSSMTGQIDPLARLSSVAGVRSIALINTQGQTVRAHHSDPTEEQSLQARLAPLPQLLQSIPVACIGMDIIYQQGRVLIWDIDEYTLFIIADPHINKALLTTTLASLMIHLQPKGNQHPNLAVSTTSMYPQLAPEQSVAPAVMKALQQEFARSIGPIAALKIKKETKRMGFSHKQFPKAHLKTLINKLGEHLATDKQKTFLANAQALIEQESV